MRLSRPSHTSVALITLAFGLAACDSAPDAPVADEPAGRFQFRVPNAGKADGETGLLPVAQLAEIEATLQTAIAATEQKIVALEADIVRIEASHRAKLAEIDSLLRQIESRKAEIKSNLEAKAAVGIISGIFGIFFPPLLLVTGASLLAAYDDDTRLDQLESSLARARADRAALEQQRVVYVAKTDALKRELASLRAAKAELVALLASEPPPFDANVERPRGASPTLDQVRWRIGTMRRILENNTSQIEVLEAIRALAIELGAAIDLALATLRDLSAAADDMLADSNDAFEDLVALALAPDPLAAAELWLEGWLAAKTKALLAHYDWPVAEFVDFLIGHRASTGGEVLEDLRGRLVDAITNAALDVVWPEPTTPEEPTTPSAEPSEEPTTPEEPVSEEPPVEEPAPEPVVIPTLLHEMVYDTKSFDTDVYVALSGAPGTDLLAWTLVGINGRGGAPYLTCVLSGTIGDDGRFLVVHTKATSPALRAAADVVTDCDLQNGPDSVLLVDPSGQVRDSLAYGVFTASDIAAGEGAPHPGPTANSGKAIARVVEGGDTNDNLSDWVVVTPSY